MAPLSKPVAYRLVWALAPRAFRQRHAEAIDAQLAEDLGAHLRAGGRRSAFWLRAVIETVQSLPALWLATGRRVGRRTLPHERVSPMDDLIQDLRYGLRGLIARPGMTLLCIVAITLGIGANATVFTIANEIFLRPLAVHEPSRLVDLHVEQPGANSFVGFSYPELLDLRRAAGLDGLSATIGTRLRLGDATGTPVIGQFASANHLALLGVEVAAGRLFSALEDVTGGPPVAVVTHGFWQRRLGGRPDVIGSSIELEGMPVTIIGVLAPPFAGRFVGFPSEFWLPLHAVEAIRPGLQLDDRTAQDLEVIGRLAPGATRETAAAALNVVAAALEESYPDTHRDRRVEVTAFTGLDSSLRGGLIGFLGVLGTLAALVLAAACLNVGSLLLARGQTRGPEFATRLALGGSRVRIVRQVMTETVLIFALGMTVAIVASIQLTALLRALIGALPIPLDLALRLDWRVLAITGAVALATALATGAQPALRAAGHAPADALRSARSGSPRERRLRSAFVGAQVAVSVALLLVAGLFTRALQSGAERDPGLDADGLYVAGLALDPSQVDEGEATRLFAELVEEVGALPGVEAVGLGSASPVGVARTPIAIDVPGLVPPAGQDAHFVDLHVVDPGYLTATGIPLVRGRWIDRPDDDEAQPVAVVNRAMERLLWPRSGAVGEQILSAGRTITIVGVVADTRHLVQSDESGPLLYLPLRQHPRLTISLVARSSMAPAELSPGILAAADRVAPSLRVGSVRPQRELLDSFVLPQRIAARAAGALGTVALLLAAAGIYGMVAFAVASRRREIGIRLALGAEPSGAVRLLLRSALLLVGGGAAAGAIVSLALGPVLRAFLLGVSPLDPVALVTVIAGTLAVALLAAWLPARRAGTIDPALALRNE